MLRLAICTFRNGFIQGSLAVLGSSAIWAVIGAGLTGTTVFPLAISCILCSTAAGTLFLLSRPLKQSFRAVIHKIGMRRLLIITTLEIVTGACFFSALQLAPIGPVIALHLTSPVVLMVVGTALGHRPMTRRTLLSLSLIVSALVMIGLGHHDSNGQGKLWLGLGLSFVSALSLTAFLTVAKGAVTDIAPLACAGVNAAVLAVMTAPALLVARPSAADLGLLIVLGLLSAPAAICNWFALRRLPETTIGSIALTQPLLGSIASYTIHHTTPSPLEALAVMLVIGGIYLDLSRPEPQPCPRDQVLP